MKYLLDMRLLSGLLGLFGIEIVNNINTLYIIEKMLLEAVIAGLTIIILLNKYKSDKKHPCE
jgi:hypothetical protein